VLERLLRVAATACSLLVLAGWSLFAVDEVRSASDATVAELASKDRAGIDPTPADERQRERLNHATRESVDDVNDVLLAPFTAFVDGAGSQWVQRSVPALLGLLLYGFGLGYLARYARSRPAPLHRYVSTRVPSRTQP